MAAKRLSASSAARLMNCPGSANLEAAIPGWVPPVEDPNKWVAKGKGDIIHDVLKELGETPPDVALEYSRILSDLQAIRNPQRDKIIRDTAELQKIYDRTLERYIGPGGFANFAHVLGKLVGIEPKLIRFAAKALEDLQAMKRSMQYERNVIWWYEKEMATNWLIRPGKTTADVMGVAGSHLTIIDYKTGSVPVEAVGNDQLMFYAWTLYKSVSGVTRNKLFTVGLHIMQPDNFNEWNITVPELEKWSKTVLEAEQRIIDGDTTLKPGGHCTFCPANPQARGERGSPLCPAMMDRLYPDDMNVGAILDMMGD